MGVVIFINRAVLAKTLDSWRLLPRTQDFTELYFTDYHKLADSLKSDETQHVVFTVHNLEHRPTTYHFKIVALSENGDVQRALGDGTFTLTADALKQIDVPTLVPPIDERVNVKVSLDYQGVAFGDGTPSLQTQSIHHWVKVSDFLTVTKGSHG